MKDTIQKLIDRKIFQVGTLVDAPVKTWQMGQPFYTSKTLRVKEVHRNYCVADEEFNIKPEDMIEKISYDTISKVDGMDPLDLAAVYHLVPKTARFQKKKTDK